MRRLSLWLAMTLTLLWSGVVAERPMPTFRTRPGRLAALAARERPGHGGRRARAARAGRLRLAAGRDAGPSPPPARGATPSCPPATSMIPPKERPPAVASTSSTREPQPVVGWCTRRAGAAMRSVPRLVLLVPLLVLGSIGMGRCATQEFDLGVGAFEIGQDRAILWTHAVPVDPDARSIASGSSSRGTRASPTSSAARQLRRRPITTSPRACS